MDGAQIFLIVVAVAIAIAFIVWQARLAAKHKQELMAWIASKNLRFDPHSDYQFERRFPGFGCLTQGENRYAYNRISGDWKGFELIGFDYHYETESRDSKGNRQVHHHHFSGVILVSKVPLKPLFIRPEGFMDKIGEFFGANDIDFESIEFSKKFYVKAAEKKWAFDVIHQRAMEFLLTQPVFSLQMNGQYLLAYRESRFAIPEYEQAADLAQGLLSLMPDYLIKQQSETGLKG